MKTLFATLAAVAAVTAAAPAAAQAYGPDRGDRYERNHDRAGWDRQWSRGEYYNLNQRQARLEQRIDRGVRSGALTRNEARHLREQFRDIERLERRYRANGLNRNERADLDRRFDRFERRLVAQLRDNQYAYRR
jgi:hypothetical protein